MALQSALSSTPCKPEALAVEHESRNYLSELKEMIATLATAISELKKDIQKNMKKEINGFLKINKKLRLEMQELQQDNKDLEKRIYNRFDATFESMLRKIEEHIQENESKLRELADQLEDVKQTFTTRIETAQHFASTANGKATAANFECKKLGDRLATLEDGCRRNNIRVEGLPENRESPNPVKLVAELFSKIIGEDFKSDTEIAAAYRIRGSNTSTPRTLIVRFERLQFKLNVMALLRQKQAIIFENNHIRIFPDYSPSTAAKRATFYNIKQWLWKADIRYTEKELRNRILSWHEAT
uniref:L1 transposable element RRM domain-containing protein n=1 Tax=Erpetoichthys calabaricus TaxID=27687 RepID=A0A8C4RHV1_ERPCA